MHWNHFLNRIRISGLKVFIVSLVFILILSLALMLRTFTGKTEVDAYHFVAEMNQALSSGDMKAMEPYVQDKTGWNEQLAADLTPFETKLQALTLKELRLNVSDYKVDRLRNQMDLSLNVEAPDLTLLGKNWIKDARNQEEALEAYAEALKDLPQAESEDVELLVDDVLAHVGSQARVVEVNKLADALTKDFRSELDDLRPLLLEYNDQVSLVKPTKPTAAKDPAGPVPIDEEELQEDAESEAPIDEKAKTTSEATTTPTTVEPSPSTDTTTTLPSSTPTTTPTTIPSTTPRVTEPPVVSTVPTTTPAPAPPPTVPPTTVPTTTPAPTVPPTTVPSTTPAPQYPTIGQYYTVNSMNEDLVQIARLAYSNYANPEDYVYLIIEQNGLQIVDGRVILYYGQTIYLPVP